VDSGYHHHRHHHYHHHNLLRVSALSVPSSSIKHTEEIKCCVPYCIIHTFLCSLPAAIECTYS
jgi:hypothetical protein